MPGYLIDLGLRVTDLTRLSRVCRRPRQIHSPCSRCWFSLLIVVATTISSMARFDGDADLFAGRDHGTSNVHCQRSLEELGGAFQALFGAREVTDSGDGALGEGSSLRTPDIKSKGRMKMLMQPEFLTGRILRLAAVAFVAIAALVVANPVDAGADSVTPPTNISSDCSANAGGALGTWLNGLPDNSTVEFPTDGCYLIGTSLKIQSTSGLTIVGNGTTLRQASPGPKTTIRPIVLLTLDHNLTMNDLDIDGAYDGANGGVNYEGNYGLLLEADSGVTLAGLKVDDIQGDFIDLNAPDSGFTGSSHALNTNVSVTGSTFKNAGIPRRDR